MSMLGRSGSAGDAPKPGDPAVAAMLADSELAPFWLNRPEVALPGLRSVGIIRPTWW